jgi:hypothetical protein
MRRIELEELAGPVAVKLVGGGDVGFEVRSGLEFVRASIARSVRFTQVARNAAPPAASRRQCGFLSVGDPAHLARPSE